MASDDSSPIPIPPALTLSEGGEYEHEALREDKQTAEPYFHPAWAKVEEMFSDAISGWENVQAINKDLPSDEFKVEARANAKAAGLLRGVLGRVKDAVESTERAIQPDEGGD